jgi:hypothetical protein
LFKSGEDLFILMLSLKVIVFKFFLTLGFSIFLLDKSTSSSTSSFSSSSFWKISLLLAVFALAFLISVPASKENSFLLAASTKYFFFSGTLLEFKGERSLPLSSLNVRLRH